MATKAELLAEAEAAYHQLLTGRAVKVVVDQNGERLEFQVGRKGDLAAYIEKLKLDVAGTTPCGPLRVFF